MRQSSPAANHLTIFIRNRPHFHPSKHRVVTIFIFEVKNSLNFLLVLNRSNLDFYFSQAVGVQFCLLKKANRSKFDFEDAVE